MRSKPIAIIPARGGSRRLPGKNLLRIHGTGETVLSHAIKLAKVVCDLVCVSTDSMPIADEAMKSGAVFLQRSIEKAENEIGTQEVIADALEHMPPELSVADDCTVICLYPCTPLLRVEHLVSALTLSEFNRDKFIRSVGMFSTPIHAAMERTQNGHLRPAMPQFNGWDSSKFPPRYFDAGQFYIGAAKLYRDRIDLDYNAVPYVLPPWVAVDINTLEDWSLAMRLFHGKDFQGEGVE